VPWWWPGDSPPCGVATQPQTPNAKGFGSGSGSAAACCGAAPDRRLHEPIKYGFFNAATPTTRFPAFFSAIIIIISLALSLSPPLFFFKKKTAQGGCAAAAQWRANSLAVSLAGRSTTALRCAAHAHTLLPSLLIRSLKCPKPNHSEPLSLSLSLAPPLLPSAPTHTGSSPHPHPLLSPPPPPHARTMAISELG
jgi:hypothetical protein